jgi:hypothetical protein
MICLSGQVKSITTTNKRIFINVANTSAVSTPKQTKVYAQAKKLKKDAWVTLKTESLYTKDGVLQVIKSIVVDEGFQLKR